MTGPATLLTTVLITSAFTVPTLAEDFRPYKHPDIDMQFTAGHGWDHVPRPGDEGTHERVDRETGLHVLMWHTTSEQSAKSYLAKMSDMMEDGGETGCNLFRP